MPTQQSLKIGICADHGGFDLKEKLISFLIKNNFEIIDFGATELNSDDDFPDYVITLAKSVAAEEVFRGIAICGSGVGACIAANKVAGVRAALITEHFSAHQGVEDDNMNLICLGGRVTGDASAEELVLAFLKAKFIGAERHLRRLKKIEDLENNRNSS
ncbi:RpiB/LacA/LacB family sugar-phosphate isomerase [Kaistella antarctica]|uniref:Probable ribose-5-phosphate isomerase B n=1 Tax=Kaistella antarctica TaxID=266748 RepID=A0A3S4WQ22_9FLAO|nr:RpiB/LacA/LacB family sugar-phosphate isomerase [Kaistella antarctica]KEY19610.1 ribose 5-phosphate isomerase [Kaistella antarctica]SEW08991.1 ribose 5-phosphate isomerase B [Kaistella antarctica]VEH96985.1 Probable ribose-5-phosphate isomerase B [Kaistella antarctica]